MIHIRSSKSNSQSSYHKIYPKSQYYDYFYKNEARGLRNMGNTCYLNSALQCLHKTIYFQNYFAKKMQQIRNTS